MFVRLHVLVSMVCLHAMYAHVYWCMYVCTCVSEHALSIALQLAIPTYVYVYVLC